MKFLTAFGRTGMSLIWEDGGAAEPPHHPYIKNFTLSFRMERSGMRNLLRYQTEESLLVILFSPDIGVKKYFFVSKFI